MLSKNWDRMFQEIEDSELNKYKICPSCNEAVSSENEFCPHCGTKLLTHTAASWICPECGTENRTASFNCVRCGKPNPVFQELKEASKK